jgi:hypothetical protein
MCDEKERGGEKGDERSETYESVAISNAKCMNRNRNNEIN